MLALLFALPNLFGEDPALQIERKDHAPMDRRGAPSRSRQLLQRQHLGFKRDYLDSGRLMVRFNDVARQLKARDAVNAKYADQYITGAVVRFARAGLDARAGPEGRCRWAWICAAGCTCSTRSTCKARVASCSTAMSRASRRALDRAKLPFTDIAPIVASAAAHVRTACA